MVGRELMGLEDDLLTLDETGGVAGTTLVGEGALMAALNRERTGHMADIVATIQRDQDEIIRAPVKSTVVVTGGPGTGKTVVALHRAAYLLYTHRERIANNGVLFVGPSSLFLRYVERVLPSLGEAGVEQVVLADLVPEHVRVRSELVAGRIMPPQYQSTPRPSCTRNSYWCSNYNSPSCSSSTTNSCTSSSLGSWPSYHPSWVAITASSSPSL